MKPCSILAPPGRDSSKKLAKSTDTCLAPVHRTGKVAPVKRHATLHKGGITTLPVPLCCLPSKHIVAVVAVAVGVSSPIGRKTDISDLHNVSCMMFGESMAS